MRSRRGGGGGGGGGGKMLSGETGMYGNTGKRVLSNNVSYCYKEWSLIVS